MPKIRVRETEINAQRGLVGMPRSYARARLCADAVIPGRLRAELEDLRLHLRDLVFRSSLDASLGPETADD